MKISRHTIGSAPALGMVCAAFFLWGAGDVTAREALTGARVYQEHCVRCHGPQGEGVAGKHDEPLYGGKSVEALSRYIQRTMPEDRKKKATRQQADLVSQYIYDAFYSPAARARLAPARIDLARLTNRQFQESVADLVGAFSKGGRASKSGGLQGEYFASEGMNKKSRKAFSRLDSRIQFDFGANSPGEGMPADQFSIAWHGSLLAPDTGVYELRLRTPNGARLYLNADLAEGDSNLRDDSDARRHSASLDLWVSSGEMREAVTRVYLLGGRSYPLRLDFFKFKDKAASLALEWKTPHGEWESLPPEHLSPENSAVVTAPTVEFPADDGSLGYERGTIVSRAWQDANLRAAVEIAGRVAARLEKLSGVSEKDPQRKAKLEEFAARFVSTAFRRPLAPDQREQYVKKPFAAASTPELAVKRVVILTLASPRFLYPEVGGEVDGYTIASRLALYLWDSLPDRELLQAAERGELLNESKARLQAERMLKDPRAKEKLREFFHHWLLMDEAEDIQKDPKMYAGFDPALIADLRKSLERFVEEIAWSEASDYRELLLADYLFVNRRLASFYGVEAPGEGEFRKVPFPAGQRSGVITHPFVLSVLSYHRSSSPIHRGVFLTRNVLGRFLKPPPMAIVFMDDRFDPSLTMREKVTELTKPANCMGCHVTINPLGFALENYDAAGRWRTVENNRPVNPVSDYLTSTGEKIRLKGVHDLAQHAAQSDEARLGFVRQLFQSTVKQTPAAYGSDLLPRLDARFKAAGFHIRTLFLDSAISAALHDQPARAEAGAPGSGEKKDKNEKEST